MLKKIIFYTIASLALAAGSVVGWYFYKKYQSANILIPQSTSSLLKVNVEALFRKKIFTSAGSYTPQKIRGLNMPFNIFLYRITEQTPLGFAGKLKIKNVSDFKSSIAKECEQITQTNLVFYKIKSLPLYFIYSSKSLVFSTFKPDSAAEKIMQSILNEDDMIPLHQSAFTEIIKETADIGYVSKNVNARINFEKGYANATIAVQGLAENIQHTYAPEIDTTSCVAFAYKGKAAWLLDNSLFNQAGKFQKASLQKYLASGFCFFINGSADLVRQRVDYVYNDNFEKTEVVQTFVEKIPAVFLKTNVYKDFCNYACQSGFIQGSGIDTASTFLWQYNAKCSENEFAMFTAGEEDSLKKNPAFFQNKEILSGKINFSAMKEKPEWNFAQKFIKPFETLIIKGFQKSKHFSVEAKIIYTDANEHALNVFLQMFQE